MRPFCSSIKGKNEIILKNSSKQDKYCHCMIRSYSSGTGMKRTPLTCLKCMFTANEVSGTTGTMNLES